MIRLLHRLLLTPIFFACVAAWAADPIRPNVVFIRTDDQALWALGVNGNTEIHTPNMDRIHREGAHLTRAFVTTPVCSPSRVALMTGLHGIQAGVTEWIHPSDLAHGVNPEFITWPEVFQASGYVTGYVGKWHLGTAPEFHATRNGFHYFMGIPTGGTRPLGPQLEIHGVLRAMPGRYTTDLLGDEALHFIRLNRDVPFLLMLEFRAPHAPYAPSPPADSLLYADLDPTIPEVEGIDRERCKRLTREYYAAISAVDRNVGALLDLLDELDLAQNTIVVFTSDHGYMIGHHGLWHKGNATSFPAPPGEHDPETWKDPERRRPNMFDDSIRVPLAIRWPARIEPGTTIDAMVTQMDLYPTLLALAGLRVPDLPPIQPMQGRDFSPMLLGRSIPWPNEIFGDYDMSTGKRARMRMIRTERWKLVTHDEEEGGAHELFDLQTDPGELSNLYAAPAHREVRLDLLRRLADWQSRIGDPLLGR